MYHQFEYSLHCAWMQFFHEKIIFRQAQTKRQAAHKIQADDKPTAASFLRCWPESNLLVIVEAHSIVDTGRLACGQGAEKEQYLDGVGFLFVLPFDSQTKLFYSFSKYIWLRNWQAQSQPLGCVVYCLCPVVRH
jgi:hypothetical protein